MNNVDRLLRIIYRELNLAELIDKISSYEGVQPYSFDIKNDSLISSIAMMYATVYPDNYSYEEVLNTLSYYNNCIIKFAGSGVPDFYNLFYLCAEKLIKVKDKNLYVNFDNLLEWDGICNKIDGNIVISALMSHNAFEFCAEKVGVVLGHDNTNINKIMSKGAADNHMHFNASGYSVEMSWACLMTCGFYEDKRLAEFVSSSSMLQECFCRNVDEGVLLLKKIKIIRLILEQVISDEDKNRGLYKENIIDKDETKNFEEKTRRRTKREIINLLKSSSDTVFYEHISWIENQLDMLEIKYAQCVNDVEKYYKLEREFLAGGFRYLLNSRTDPIYRFLFNLYLSGICKIRFYFVQDNAGMGFEKFKFRESVKEDWFELVTVNKIRIAGKKSLCKSVFDRCYKAKCVKYAEFRIAPKAGSVLSDFIDRLEEANDEIYKKYASTVKDKIKFGVVVHFLKQKNCKKPDCGMYRFEEFRNKLDKKANALIAFIERKYKNFEKIVGVDAANYEVNCRPEVFADIFRKLKSTVATQKQFGFTFHVGEAFETLCSGIRAIDETVEFMNFGDGDRMGHAIALGIDVGLFREKKRNQLNVRLGTYVDDLVWMYFILKDAHCARTALQFYLRSEFEKYKKQLFENVFCPVGYAEIDIDDYVDSWILRGDSPSLYLELPREIRICKYESYNWEINKNLKGHKEAFYNENAVNLYKLYLCNRRFYDNCETAICIQPENDYWEAVSLVQQIVHNKIYKKKIAIETNPSSNRKISPVSKFIELPFIRFNSNGLTSDKNDKREDIPISINTDDGSIFQSDLANEYALVAACLYRENYNLQEIYRYIDYLRNGSITQMFIDDAKL